MYFLVTNSAGPNYNCFPCGVSLMKQTLKCLNIFSSQYLIQTPCLLVGNVKHTHTHRHTKNLFTLSTSQISTNKILYQYSNTNFHTFIMHRSLVENTIVFNITRALTLNVNRQIRIPAALAYANSVKDQKKISYYDKTETCTYYFLLIVLMGSH